jgi:hypothetical protein
MALTIIATAGAIDANSYVTEAEYTAYMETKLYATAFLALSEDDKKKVTIESARMLDIYFKFYGTRTNLSPMQSLAFPRTNVFGVGGLLIDSTTIPQNLKNAQCEQMVYFATTNPLSPIYNKYNKVLLGDGAISVEYNKDLTYKTINSVVVDMLRMYGSVLNNADNCKAYSLPLNRS